MKLTQEQYDRRYAKRSCKSCGRKFSKAGDFMQGGDLKWQCGPCGKREANAIFAKLIAQPVPFPQRRQHGPE